MLALTRQNPKLPLALVDSRPIQILKDEHEAEVLDFLAGHPLRTFVMAGWIRDNGLVSPLNRGDFYACRNSRGELEGVALIGHVTLFEANSDSVIAALACLTQTCASAHTVMGAEEKVDRFLSYYTRGGPQPRVAIRELLFEQRSKWLEESVPGLRRATTEELELVVPVHAEMAFAETGVDPLDVDPAGFRDRCLRRIQQGRVWVCVDDGRLMFKADVISDLPEVTYLEGVYVSPEKRSTGYGQRCVRQLTNKLLTHTRSVCVLVKEQNHAAQACYQKAGYKLRDYYQTLFL